MKSSYIILCGLALVLVTGVPSRAATAPFAIAATDVTMTRSGTAISQFTITGIPLDGTIYLRCAYAGNTAMEKMVPICPMTPPRLYTVTAGGTLQGPITFYPPTNVAIPASAPVAGAALAAVLLLGLGFRRRCRGCLALLALCVACLAGMTACGGSNNGMTPGTYPYTITAVNNATSTTPLSVMVNTTINVTVP